ncbi:MAG: C4-dicarboxylate transporter DctA [Deltaproteobacteria bacterium]|nr:C4-dicarboxylate transporter DctA [Deltaproteobacteria bacterium]
MTEAEAIVVETVRPGQASEKLGFIRTLYFRVLVGIAIGVLVGALAPGAADYFEPLAQGFIKLVKMTIAPLIFCTVVVGIAGTHSLKQVGKAGGLALLYFEVASTVALVIGLIIVNLVSPGAGLHKSLTPADAEKVAAFLGKQPKSNFVLDLIPDLGGSHVLSVLLIAILVGVAMQRIGARAEAIERAGKVVFEIVAMIMQLAPLGAMGAMQVTISKYGLGSLASLAELMGCFYGTCLIFIIGVLGLVARIHGFSIFRFIRYIKQELFIVLGTSSSESVLPRMMEKLERLGAAKRTVGLVVPAGYSFNLDGTAIYITMGAIFVAQATNHDLSLGSQLALLGVALLTSKGAAGVTGSGFVALAATLEAFHNEVPVAGLALILGIDRFMSEARSLTNVIGNGVATLVVSRWCGDLDREQLARELQNDDESR